MPSLEYEAAKEIAGSLTTIGHPWAETAIRATAFDLMKWCKGAVIDGRVWSPEAQAQAIVDQAREEWLDGWPQNGGTRALKGLYDRMFPTKVAAAPPATVPELAARGLLAPPCSFCDAGAEFCEYGGPRGHKRFLDDLAARVPDPPKRQAPVISIEDVIRDGRRVYEEEQRRKRQQIEDVSDDYLRGAS